MLVYLSYPIHDYNERPVWVQTLKNTAPDGWAFFDPWVGFTEQLQEPLFSSLLVKKKPNPVAAAHCDVLKLEPALFLPLSDVTGRLIHSDQAPTTEHVFRELYVLMRSDAVVVDLNTRSHGGGAQAPLYAHLLDLPVVGLTERFVLSPWLLAHAQVILRMSDREGLFRQIDTLLTEKNLKAAERVAARGAGVEKPDAKEPGRARKPTTKRSTRTGSGKR